jgi:hypothetical protein
MTASAIGLSRLNERCSFSEEKEPKRLLVVGINRHGGATPAEQKFFGYFFSKK